jgi:HEAT repeat protein
MDIFALIYVGGTALAAAAVTVVLLLILRRLLRMRWQIHIEAIRRGLLTGILAAIDSADPPATLIAGLRRHPAIARDLVAELSEIIRGDSRLRLVRLAREAGLDRWLQSQLRSRRAEARRLAAEQLRLFDDIETAVVLRDGLEDRDAEVRLNAALALAELGVAPPIDILVRRLEAGAQEHSLLLRRLFDRMVRWDANGVFAVACGQVGHPSLRPLAIEALGTTGWVEVAADLANLASDPDAGVRTAVLSALANLGHPAVGAIVGAGIDDSDWRVRAAAIDAARRIALFDLVPQIAARLEDEVWWVRFRAGVALAALGEAGIAALRRLADSGRDAGRRMASIIMAEQGLA